MNKKKFLSIMALYGDTQSTLAEAIGISLSAINYKINEKGSSFTQPEILKIKHRYKLSAEEIDEIFFSSDVE